MKKFNFILAVFTAMIVLGLTITVLGQINSNKKTDLNIKEKLLIDWEGEYTYEEDGPVSYTITIFKNGKGTFYGVGRQTWFGINIDWEENGAKIDLYYKGTYEGAFLPADWLDRDRPYATLFKKKGSYYLNYTQFKGKGNTHKISKIG